MPGDKEKSVAIPIIGVCQIIASIVFIGLVGKRYTDEVGKFEKINTFGSLLAGLLVTTTGIIGILSQFCGNINLVIFNIFCPVALSVTAVAGWIFSVDIQRCLPQGFFNSALICPYDKSQRDLNIAILAFSIACCLLSLIGLIVATYLITTRLNAKISASTVAPAGAPAVVTF